MKPIGGRLLRKKRLIKKALKHFMEILDKYAIKFNNFFEPLDDSNDTLTSK